MITDIRQAHGHNSIPARDHLIKHTVGAPSSVVRQNATKSANTACFIVFFCIFGIGWPIWLASGVDERTPLLSAAMLTQSAIVIYASTRLAWVFSLGAPDWLQITFWSFTYTWLGVAPLVQLVARHSPLHQTIDVPTATEQSILVLASLTLYDFGRYIASRRKTTMSEPCKKRRLDRRRVTILAVAAVALTPLFVQLLGGISELFNSRAARLGVLQDAGLYTESSKTSGAIITAFASIIPFLGLYYLWLFIGMRSRDKSKVSVMRILLTVLLVASNILINNPISSSRFWVLTVILSFGFSLTLLQRPWAVRSIVTGFLVCSVVFFPYLDAFRNGALQITRRTPADFFLYKTDYDAMSQIGNALRFTEEYGHTWGEQLMGALLFWVPRTAWPNKPIDTGSLLAQFVHYPNENLSGPLAAELYIDFGYVGVAIGFASLGFCTLVASRTYLLQLGGPLTERSSITLILPILAMYQVIILRGSLLQAMGRLAVITILILALTKRESLEVTTR